MRPDEVEERSYQLLRAANQLAAHSFADWAEFVKALGMYSEVPMMRLLLVNANEASLASLQGSARMAHELVDMMLNCKQHLEVLEQKRAAQQRLPKKGKV